MKKENSEAVRTVMEVRVEGRRRIYIYISEK